MSEYRTSDGYIEMEGLNTYGDARLPICFCIDTSGSMTDKLHIFGTERKIDLLSEVLKRIIDGFRQDQLMCHSVAISIVTYNTYAQTKVEFMDAALYEDSAARCRFNEVDGATFMSRGLNTAMNAINAFKRDCAINDCPSRYTPILVFMTDGEPCEYDSKYTETFAWKEVFIEVRRRVESEALQIFPVGIGERANMRLLGELLPRNKKASDFVSRYCMHKEDDFIRVFDEIKEFVYKQLSIYSPIVTNSDPAYKNEDIQNTQSGITDPSYILNFIE